MDDGLQTTLDLLAETENEAAIRVLIPALDSRFRAIRHGAFQAILAPAARPATAKWSRGCTRSIPRSGTSLRRITAG